MGRRAVMRLERHREVRRLKVLSRQIGGQGQLLRVILVLRSGLGCRRTVGQPVQGLELFGGNGRGCRGAGWRCEVVGTGPDDSRGWLGVRADRGIPVWYPVRWTRAVVGSGTAAVTVHGGPAKVQMRRRRQIVMMMMMRKRMIVMIGTVMVMLAGGGVRGPS